MYLNEETLLAWEKGWLKGLSLLNRRPEGWYKKTYCAFNYSTGAAAINLAFLLGASRVILLGYDFKVNEKGEHNWHPNPLDPAQPELYAPEGKFLKGFRRIRMEMGNFPHFQVLNAGPDSALEEFPRIRLEEVL